MLSIKKLFSLALLAGSATAFAAPVTLPVDGLDTSDVDYNGYYSNCGGSMSCINDARSLGPGGGGDHFDEALGVSVNGTGYMTTAGDLTGNTLTLNAVSIGNFDVQVTLRSSGPVMRQIVTVHNNGATAATASVRWHNNTGNDSAQQVIASSDGDTIGEATDRWIVTADSLSGTDNEVNSWVLFGPGSPSVTPSSLAMVDGDPNFGFSGEQGINAIFDLALNPNGIASLMWFVGIEGINQDGIDLAMGFNDTDSAFFQSLISDLTSTERSQIVNWDLGAQVPEPATLALMGLGLAGIGYRRHRNKKAA